MATKKRPDGQRVAVGEKCKDCALVHARGYNGLTWAEMVGKCKTSTEFANSLLKAKKVMSGKQSRDFAEESATDSERVTVACTRSFFFYTVADLEKRFELKSLSACSELPWVELPDEWGEKAKGVLVSTDEPRKVSISHCRDVEAKKTILGTAAVIREGQGADTAKAHCVSQCAPVRAQGRPGLNDARLSELMSELRASRAAAAAAVSREPAPLEEAAAVKVPEDAVEQDPEIQEALRLAMASQPEPEKTKGNKKPKAQERKRMSLAALDKPKKTKSCKQQRSGGPRPCCCSGEAGAARARA